VLGVSGGAALGGSLVLVAANAATQFLRPGAAVLAAASSDRWRARPAPRCWSSRWGESSSRTLLVGVVFNAFSAAVITLLQFLVAPQQAVQFLRWLIGAIRYEQSGTLVVGAVFMLAAVGALVVLSASAATGAAVALSGMVGL